MQAFQQGKTSTTQYSIAQTSFNGQVSPWDLILVSGPKTTNTILHGAFLFISITFNLKKNITRANIIRKNLLDQYKFQHHKSLQLMNSFFYINSTLNCHALFWYHRHEACYMVQLNTPFPWKITLQNLSYHILIIVGFHSLKFKPASNQRHDSFYIPVLQLA